MSGGNELAVSKRRSYFPCEYKKHIKHNISPLLWYGLIFLLTQILLFMLVSRSSPYIKTLDTIRNIDAKKAIESVEKIDILPHSYKLDSLCTVYSENRKRIYANTYIQVNSEHRNTYWGNPLKDGEAAISQKLADAINVDLGDYVYLDIPIFDDLQKYKVSQITPFLPDYYDVMENMDFSTIALGNNEKLVSQIRGKYVYLLDQDQFQLFMDKEYAYLQTYDYADEAASLEKAAMIWSLSVSVLWVITSVAFCVAISYTIKKEIQKYNYDSYSPSFISGLYWLDHFLFFLLPQIIGVSLFLFAIVNKMFIPGFFIVLIAGFFVGLALIYMGEKKYEKAH